MKNFIDGIGLSGYRSFGAEIQRIGPFSKINLFIGQNNSGKSNILLFLATHYKEIVENRNFETLQLSDLDHHRGSGNDIFCIEFGVKRDTEEIAKLKDHSGRRLPAHFAEIVGKILDSEALSHNTGVAWFPYQAQRGFPPLFFNDQIINSIVSENPIDPSEWQAIWSKMTNDEILPKTISKDGKTMEELWIPETLECLVDNFLQSPDVSLIPAMRRIENSSQVNPNDFSGIGIIDRLAQLQNPGHEQQQLKEQFNKINVFLRTVTGNPGATLEIPYSRDMIIVHMDNKVLPLSSLGTGIHEVVILAAAATVLHDQVVCIEEPELHMHPTLQKKLIQYLQDETSNQYFISTHSAHVLDNPHSSVFHVSYDGNASVVTPVYTDAERYTVCTDLGYRASDILQSNCIIWVEGPSDRTYINYWIRSVDSRLLEGLHYSIMFYGGRLLKHLTANDPEIDEFISLRRLNRNLAVVIDSDRRSKTDKINKTKQRVRSEIEASSGVVWVTAGREIENYINHTVLETSVKAIHPRALTLSVAGQFDDPLQVEFSRGQPVEIDKVKVAHKVSESQPDWNILDLRASIEKLVNFICEANGLK